jgi:hypothetical protein
LTEGSADLIEAVYGALESLPRDEFEGAEDPEILELVGEVDALMSQRDGLHS